MEGKGREGTRRSRGVVCQALYTARTEPAGGGDTKSGGPNPLPTAGLITGQGEDPPTLTLRAISGEPEAQSPWLLPPGPRIETPACWARGCCPLGMGRRVDRTRTRSLLRHVSETGASRPGCRHSPACLGGWQTPGLGYCQAWLAGAGSCGVRAAAQTPGTHSAASGTGRGVCPLLSACTHPCPLNRHGRRSSLRSGAWVPPTRQSLPDPGPVCE